MRRLGKTCSQHVPSETAARTFRPADDGAAELGETLAVAAQAMRDEIAVRIPADGRMPAEQIAKLKVSDATMSKLRGKVEKLLRQGYARGASTAGNEVQAARERPVRPRAPPTGATVLLAVQIDRRA